MLQASPGINGRRYHQIKVLSLKHSGKQLSIWKTFHLLAPHRFVPVQKQLTFAVGWSKKIGKLRAGWIFKSIACAALATATKDCANSLRLIASATVEAVAIFINLGRDWNADQAVRWSGRITLIVPMAAFKADIGDFYNSRCAPWNVASPVYVGLLSNCREPVKTFWRKKFVSRTPGIKKSQSKMVYLTFVVPTLTMDDITNHRLKLQGVQSLAT